METGFRHIGALLWMPLDRFGQDLVHMPDRQDAQGPPHPGRNFLEVLLVVLGNQHPVDAGAFGGQQLLLEPTDGKDPSAQGNFPVIARFWSTQRPVRADTRAVAMVIPAEVRPWEWPLRDMDVDVDFTVKILFQAEFGPPRADIAQRGMGGLAHHLAEFAGDGQFPLPRHHGRFDGQQFSPHLGPSQAVGQADPVLGLLDAEAVAGHTKIFPDLLGTDLEMAGSSGFDHLAGNLATDGGEFPFQVAHPGLARVAAQDFAQRRLAEPDLVRLQAVGFDLLGQQ